MQLLNLKDNCSMATHKTKYVFKATKYFKTTVHYSLEPTAQFLHISNKLNIAESRHFAKSKPIFWCQEHINNKWAKPRLTGLFKTEKENVFWGCRGKYQDLILFEFSNNKEVLTVHYFKNFFTRNLTQIINNL